MRAAFDVHVQTNVQLFLDALTIHLSIRLSDTTPETTNDHTHTGSCPHGYHAHMCAHSHAPANCVTAIKKEAAAQTHLPADPAGVHVHVCRRKQTKKKRLWKKGSGRGRKERKVFIRLDVDRILGRGPFSGIRLAGACVCHSFQGSQEVSGEWRASPCTRWTTGLKTR